MALEQVSSVTRSIYVNTVAGYNIQYNITQDEGSNAQSVTGVVKKGDVRFGYITVNADKSKNISFDKEITDDDSKLIYEAILADAASIFSERNN